MFLVRLTGAELVAPSGLTFNESTQQGFFLYVKRLLLRYLRDLSAFGGPSWPFFFVSLEFFKFVVLAIFVTFLTFSVFLHSTKNPCYFCDQNFVLFVFLLMRYFQVIVSQNLRKLRREFANNIVPGHIYRIFFSFTVFYALPRHTIQTVKQGGGGS